MPRNFLDQDIAKAISIAILNPGIDQDRLAAKLGYSPRSADGKRNSRVAGILKKMIETNAIVLVAEPHAQAKDAKRVFITTAELENQQQQKKRDLAAIDEEIRALRDQISALERERELNVSVQKAIDDQIAACRKAG